MSGVSASWALTVVSLWVILNTATPVAVHKLSFHLSAPHDGAALLSGGVKLQSQVLPETTGEPQAQEYVGKQQQQQQRELHTSHSVTQDNVLTGSDVQNSSVSLHSSTEDVALGEEEDLGFQNHSWESGSSSVASSREVNKKYLIASALSSLKPLVTSAVSVPTVAAADTQQVPVDRTQVSRRSADTDSLTTVAEVQHRHRHGHFDIPPWLSNLLQESAEETGDEVGARDLEEEIANVFREVAYGNSKSKGYPSVRRAQARPVVSNAGTNSRIERTTALTENPQLDYSAAEKDNSTSRNPDARKESDQSKNGTVISNSTSSKRDAETRKTDIEKLLELKEYDHELYDLYDGHYTSGGDGNSEISRRGDTKDEVPVPLDTSDPGASQNETQTTPKIHKYVPKLSWLDVLLCTNRNLTWVLVNFLLGLVLLGLGLLAPYRLLSLRSCTQLLPRTHFVAVHLLVFVAASLKAVYLFHLAYGSKERIPLLLILLLTNTGFPCFSSAFLLIMITMFLTADVQVYKPKLFTIHNISIFIIMQLLLCFVADVIVGCTHSKSVLILSRIMLITIAIAVIVVYARKHQMVLQVSQMLKREFQGELKLLVVPAKDESQERQMSIKQILRNRLTHWCQVMKGSAVVICVLCVINLFHTVFLILSHVPVWAWWLFHVSGCLAESTMVICVCVAAALTQRYDENISFLYSFVVPQTMLLDHNGQSSEERNGNVIYQRVSFSSGTESTQYTSCYPEVAGCDPTSRTPKPPKRRLATVKRSATFSHAPQHPHTPGHHHYGPPMTRIQVARVSSSASQIPGYGPRLGSHISIYGPSLVSHVPVYRPSSAASMLVHEDGFVRIRTQLDPHEESPQRCTSQIELHGSIPRGSNPQLYDVSVQHLNGLGRQESFYQSLSRHRRNSRGPDVLQNNINFPESGYQSSPGSRRNYLHHPNHPPVVSQERPEGDYQSLSRRRKSLRDSYMKHLNNIEKEENDYQSLSTRKLSPVEHRAHLMNNLDRPESDYRSLTRRQLSREDNNSPSYQHPQQESDYHHRRSLRDSRFPPLNLYEEQNINYHLPPPCGSPSVRHKVPNFPSSPSSPTGPSSPHKFHVCASPGRTRRQATYPKPFVRVGSNASLKEDDNFYTDYYPRGNPVRRNHSSAGYFPSRDFAPPSPSLTDTQRYGSLRLGLVKRRQPGYIRNINTEILQNRFPRNTAADDSLKYAMKGTVSPVKESNVNGPPTQVEAAEVDVDSTKETDPARCASALSDATDKKRNSNESDWALELIESSSILTDFYSLKRKDDKNKETKDKENVISSDQENG